MQLTLFENVSDSNVIAKTLVSNLVLIGELRNESNVVNPTIRIEHANPTAYNYAYIPEFGRYYFITEMRSIRTNIWEVSMHVDVLMCYANAIRALPVIVMSAENDDSRYMAGAQWATTVKSKTDVINFPSGLLDSGEYILITSGGIVGAQGGE